MDLLPALDNLALELSDDELSLLQVSELRTRQLALIDQQIAAMTAGAAATKESTSSEHEIYLTAREREILELIALGRSAAEIALALFLSVPTVKSHTSSLYRKLQATSRTQALHRAVQLGIRN
jgi:DNA-binding NarL/FixJ family response regulator